LIHRNAEGGRELGWEDGLTGGRVGVYGVLLAKYGYQLR